jgi:hypothetical protein
MHNRFNQLKHILHGKGVASKGSLDKLVPSKEFSAPAARKY